MANLSSLSVAPMVHLDGGGDQVTSTPAMVLLSPPPDA